MRYRIFHSALCLQVYIYDNATRFNKEIQVNGSVESIVVYHLPKVAQLTVQVAAFNSVGKGLKSQPVRAGIGSLPAYNTIQLKTHMAPITFRNVIFARFAALSTV
jgi:hypothetical protein